jgi:hypothetical protein
MYPASFGTDRTLYADDSVAISGLYDTYQTISTAKDVAIGKDGTVWKIGTNPLGNGFQVYKLNSATGAWDASDGGAVRIAVGPTGIPWLVDSQGNLWQRTSSSVTTGAWNLLPESGRDIGVGANGDVWMISNVPFGDGFQVKKWNGSGWAASNGGAVKVSVSATGIPWVLSSLRKFYRHSSNDPSSGTWELLPGLSDDLGVGPPAMGAPDGHVWSVGTGSTGLLHLEVWDEQIGDGGTGGSSIPTVKNWVADAIVGTGGGIGSVAVGPDGVPWIVDGSGNLKIPVR